VFAAASTPLTQKFDVIIAVIAFRIAAAVECESATACTTDVEGIVDKQHSHGFADGNVQKFLFDDFAVLQRHSGDGLSVLASQQQSTFGIFGHADPRPID
jgi:hypothetical protein